MSAVMAAGGSGNMVVRRTSRIASGFGVESREGAVARFFENSAYYGRYVQKTSILQMVTQLSIANFPLT